MTIIFDHLSCQTYFLLQDTSVWISLSYVLIGILCNEIVPSYQIEGLWLCRWHHFRNAEVKQVSLLIFCPAQSLYHVPYL